MSDKDATAESPTSSTGIPYILDEVLGQGSIGTVWRGHHLGDGTPRAIKVLNPEPMRDKGTSRRSIQKRDILMSVIADAVVPVTHSVAYHDPRELVGTPLFNQAHTATPTPVLCQREQRQLMPR
ncbi:MAG: hypothetical protein Q4B98_08705 [Cutibacterium sp.]|nr:hypothetical protein [Cutibacterium sp.]MDO4413098.1 hypothetical protein [Cutibacterium sp.]